jgi:trehalose 6-phosphate phosphatase
VLRPEVQSQFEPFFRSVSLAPESALLLDYDGTLAPFRTQRNQAFPYPGIALLLQEIVRDAGSRVVVISGREVTDLLPLLNIHPRPEIWGVHGLQRLRTDGTTEMPHLDDRTLHGLSDAERWLSYKHLRHRAEFKPGGIAVHWRGLPPLDAADLRARVLLGWRPIVAENGLDLLDFDGGIEVRARKANKGDAVRDFIDEVGPYIPIAYLGDDPLPIWEMTRLMSRRSMPSELAVSLCWCGPSGGRPQLNSGCARLMSSASFSSCG